MGVRTYTARMIGKTTKTALRISGRNGSSLPGKIAMKIDPEVLRKISQDYRVIVVTGTNGKTLTTALITAVFRTHFNQVVTNSSGANMIQGIVSCFLSASHRKGPKIAVLEVDEASLKHVTALIPPEVIVFTNVFRDQMDRYGEIYTTWEKMLEGARNAPGATIIANGDMPLFHDVPLRNNVIYYGFDHLPDGDVSAHYNTDGVLCPHCNKILRYRFNTYSNLGKYFCPNCNFARRGLTYAVTEIETLTPYSSAFYIDGVRFQIPVAGLYNIYNALAAYSVARYFDFAPEAISEAMNNAQGVFGRQERIKIGEHDVTLNLIKNPVGFNQIVDLMALDKQPYSLVVLLNDLPADGTDVSWIWDGNFEKLIEMTQSRPIVVSGLRFSDLAMRFIVAGLNEGDLIRESDLEKIASHISSLPTRQVYVLATYTALLDLRKVLSSQGYMKGGIEKNETIFDLSSLRKLTKHVR